MPLLLRPVSAFFAGFNWLFERLSLGYGGMTRRLVRIPVIALVVYAGLIGLTGFQFTRAPTGFIPEQDQGYLITVIQLPPGSSLGRTDEVVRAATKLVLETPGVEHAVPFAGFDGATFTNAPNAGAIFSALQPFEDRAEAGLGAPHDPRGPERPPQRRSRKPSSSRSCRHRCAASAPAAGSR